MKDPLDSKKNLKIRFPIGKPTRRLSPRKHYTKNIKRPTTREIIEEAVEEDPIIEIKTEREDLMPYINQEARKVYDPHIDALCEELFESDWNVGHMNYIIYRIMIRFFTLRRSYQTINDIKGVLGNVWSEFYRKMAVPYEEDKEKDNGGIL